MRPGAIDTVSVSESEKLGQAPRERERDPSSEVEGLDPWRGQYHLLAWEDSASLSPALRHVASCKRQ